MISFKSILKESPNFSSEEKLGQRVQDDIELLQDRINNVIDSYVQDLLDEPEFENMNEDQLVRVVKRHLGIN